MWLYDDGNDFKFYMENNDYKGFRKCLSQYNVFYKSAMPIMLINIDYHEDKNCMFDISNVDNILVVFGHEDDGKVWFDRQYGEFTNTVHISYLDSIIEVLKEINQIYNGE